LALPIRYEVTFMPSAEVDASDLHAHIAKDSVGNADRFIMELRARAASLERWPRRCPVAPETKTAGFEVRHALFGSYRILFTIIGRHVAVLKITHAARKRARR
jgi:plasmid stabilization system protein ParE